MPERDFQDVQHNPNCDNCPIENLTGQDAQEFIEKLNMLTGKKFRLPSEAEWEYAVRGGSQSKGYAYAGSDSIELVALYRKNSGGRTQAVAQKQPNELGLYDISGNVWEWCEDDWHDNYEGAPNDDSAWIDNPRNEYRIVRGGSWYYYSPDCLTSARKKDKFNEKALDYGLRLAL